MIYSIFPTLIHNFTVDDYPSIKDKLIEFVYEEQRKDPTGRSISNLGGWQSNFFHDRKNILFNTVQEAVLKYFSTNRIFSTELTMDIDSIWANINKKGDYNQIHGHNFSDMSGVFYLKAHENCGELEFLSPNAYVQCKELEWYNRELCKETSFYTTCRMSVKESQIFIFPSSLMHKVYPNQTDDDRISVSFNIKLYKNR